MSMLEEVDLGTKVVPAAIQKYRGALGVRDVISVVSRKIQVAKAHYQDGVGYFHCFRGSCCENLGFAKIRYILPIVHYTGDNKKYGMPVYLKFLFLAKEAYEEEFLVMDELREDITKLDILVTCSDEQFQKLNFKEVGPAVWRNSNEIKQVLVNEQPSYKKLITMSVARILDEQTYQNIIMGVENQPVQVTPPATAVPVASQITNVAPPPAQQIAGGTVQAPVTGPVDDIPFGESEGVQVLDTTVVEAPVKSEEVDFNDLLE